MNGRTVGGILVFVFVVGLLVWNRMGARSEASMQIRADAMKILATMEGYQEHEKLLAPMADRAHSVAFDAAYKMAGRRTAAEFDDDKYLQAFFRSMVTQANDLNQQDLKKSLLALRSDVEEAGDEGAPPEDEKESAAAPAPATPATSDRVTVEMIAKMPKETLEEQLFDRIAQELGKSPGDERTAVRKLSKGKRMLYVTRRAEEEVNNGGFDQFFVNSTGPLAREVVRGFESAKAVEHAKLTKRAIAAFVLAQPGQKQFKVDKTVKKYMATYPDTDLGKIGDEFFKLEEDLSKLRIAYIRAHPEEFVID